MLTWATAGRSIAGSADMVSLTRANSTGSDAARNSEPTRCTAKPVMSSGTAPRVSACTWAFCVSAMMTVAPFTIPRTAAPA